MYLQDIVLNLEHHWHNNNCRILQPIPAEIGAATFHYITTLKILESRTWNVVYVQSCSRPTDSKFANSVDK